MALVGALLTGGFLAGAKVYLAGRKPEPEEPKPAPPEPTPQPQPQPGPIPPQPPSRPPTATDRAYADGVYRFEEGPDEVSALAVGPDGSTLVIGYRNGTTRVWNFDQPAFDPFGLGPRCDGPPARVQFDGTGAVVYLSGTGGTVAAPWSDPPEVPVKIPGDPLAVFPFPKGEQFAAVRGSTFVLRYVPSALVAKPPPAKGGKGAKEFLVTTPKDETLPLGVRATLAAPPQRPTFLAWHPTGKLLVGQPDGSILSWGATGPGHTRLSGEHKAAVRAWAASPSTWDFATGDDAGVVGLWENKALAPKTFAASTAAIRHLSFGPSGAHLAVADAAGGVSVWDLSEGTSVLKVTRPTAVKALAFGPADDLLLLSDGKAVELWHIPELGKQEGK
jgi:WD40 repeat protein